MNVFDLISCPLSGTHCISAGAGTGKTYAISHLYLRLLLENSYPIESLLVVTFTEAATAELKERIRTLIKNALEVLQNIQHDDEVTTIVQGHAKKHSIEKTEELLTIALHSFDEAIICTIHSFCRQILRNNAFESNMRFDTELIIDIQPQILETVQDFWRKSFHTASPYLISHMQSTGLTIEKLYSLVHRHIGQPDLEIIPKIPHQNFSSQSKTFNNAYIAVVNSWENSKSDIENILLHSLDLKRTKYRLPSIPTLINSLDTFLSNDTPNPQLFKDFIKYTTNEITDNTKKNCIPPVHPFFDLCDTLYNESQIFSNMLDKEILAIKYELFSFVHTNLSQKKADNNIYSFDDLLTNLYKALKGTYKDDLINSIRKQFKAALIDEFQDTDPIQYAIFKPVFSLLPTSLFLIGDPKQAIYSFRGADIFTFFSAVSDTIPGNQHTLQTNYRSSADYITATNTLFNNTSSPFIYESIPYTDAKIPKKHKNTTTIYIKDTPLSSICVDYFSSTRFSNQKKNSTTYNPITKKMAIELICTSVTNRILQLLNFGTIRTKDTITPVSPSDIAILVRTKNDAHSMKNFLSSASIPAVLHNAGNIFDSHEAQELCQILHAIVNPGNHQLIRSALCTSLFGLTANFLHKASKESALIERYYNEFTEYHSHWLSHGFITMFALFLKKQGIRKKILSQPNGERRLTNILHLQDLLQQQSIDGHMAMPQLLSWFSTRLDPQAPRLEEHELRLEKDGFAVQIVTMHKSKGLEYSIVFCPFTWGKSIIKNSEILFHDTNKKRIFDMGSQEFDKHKEIAQKELLAENLRLLYVAITRAKYHSSIAWGHFKNAQTSALAYLFHKPNTWDNESRLSDLSDHLLKLDDTDLLKDLHNCAKHSNKTIAICEPDIIEIKKYSAKTDQNIQLSCQEFSGTISQGKHLSSFSALAYKRHDNVELPDIEKTLPVNIISEDIEENIIKTENNSIYNFPKGAKAGNFFHSILEDIDYDKPNSDILKPILNQKLSEYGFTTDWSKTILECIQNILSVSLKTTNDSFSLSTIQKQQTTRELEFYYPLKAITPEKLNSLFSHKNFRSPDSSFPLTIDKLDFHPVQGYMHGFIDLFFEHNNRYYIIDWKSNHLGNTVANYSHTFLNQAMITHAYNLQYLIYSLAIDRFLHSRINNYSYEKHFGGVFYLFLRGVSKNHNAPEGIFFDKPNKQIIESLSHELLE